MSPAIPHVEEELALGPRVPAGGPPTHNGTTNALKRLPVMLRLFRRALTRIGELTTHPAAFGAVLLYALRLTSALPLIVLQNSR